MTYSDLAPLVKHLWQSTVFAAAIWVLALTLRRHRAAVRYRLWLAASLKFLIPFSLFVSAGSQFGRQPGPAVEPPQWSQLAGQISRPFTPAPVLPLHAAAPPAWNPVPTILFSLWLCGISVSFAWWFWCWRQMQAARRRATPLALDLPIPVLSCPTQFEPGVFGIRKPVLLLPEGIDGRLSQVQLDAIIAHEICHVCRRDNLTGALHMVVEGLFWFHPLTWWIRARLVEERERACDEEVVKSQNPDVYVEGILNVCKFCLESPPVCTAGIIGSNLKRRINGILHGEPARKLTLGSKLLLAAAGAVAVAGPVLIGLAEAPRVRAQSQDDPASWPAFDVASVKLTTHGRNAEGLSISDIKIASPGKLVGVNASLEECVRMAYDVKEYQVSGPDWINSDEASYDIEAKAPPDASPLQMALMLRALLRERFHLAVHRENRIPPVYFLTLGKNGPRLPKAADGAKGGLTSYGSRSKVRVTGDSATMEALANRLTRDLDHPVFDKTGVPGAYRVNIEWAREGDGPSVFAVLQDVGLKLEAAKAPIQILVIDHAERVPTAN